MDGFVSKQGASHIVQPIGYGQVRKTILRGARVRSAVEQFAIQQVAARFRSDMLYIPEPIMLESHRSYTMEQFYESRLIPPALYGACPNLMSVLIDFKNFMYLNNYFATGFDIFLVGENKYILVDMSHFGIIQNDIVKFSKNPTLYTVFEAEVEFGIVGTVTDSFKRRHVKTRAPEIAATLSEDELETLYLVASSYNVLVEAIPTSDHPRSDYRDYVTTVDHIELVPIRNGRA